MKGLYKALVKKGVRIREIAEAFSEGLFPTHMPGFALVSLHLV